VTDWPLVALIAAFGALAGVASAAGLIGWWSWRERREAEHRRRLDWPDITPDPHILDLADELDRASSRRARTADRPRSAT
jgi:hypothetical protein